MTTLSDGTRFETYLYKIDSGNRGPTAFVVGGQHGSEASGYRAADELCELTPRAGTLYVVPRANPPAIAAGTRGIGWDLNRSWPTGHPPTRTASRNIWDAIERVGADVVVDLHSSGGIYGEAGSGVGQAGFPTPSAKGEMKRVLSRINDLFFSDSRWPSSHEFSLGNEQNGSNPLLIHKVGGDLKPAKGFLFETWRRVPLSHQIEWNLTATRFALEECGMHVE